MPTYYSLAQQGFYEPWKILGENLREGAQRKQQARQFDLSRQDLEDYRNANIQLSYDQLAQGAEQFGQTHALAERTAQANRDRDWAQQQLDFAKLKPVVSSPLEVETRTFPSGGEASFYRNEKGGWDVVPESAFRGAPGTGASAKAPTETQAASATFFTRMAPALIDYYAANGPSIHTDAGAQYGLEWWYPNAMRSADWKAADASRGAFVTALLRRESGAAIADSEFTRYARELFPTPGDTPQNIESKKLLQLASLDIMLRNAGPAGEDARAVFARSLQDKKAAGVDVDPRIEAVVAGSGEQALGKDVYANAADLIERARLSGAIDAGELTPERVAGMKPGQKYVDGEGNLFWVKRHKDGTLSISLQPTVSDQPEGGQLPDVRPPTTAYAPGAGMPAPAAAQQAPPVVRELSPPLRIEPVTNTFSNFGSRRRP